MDSRDDPPGSATHSLSADVGPRVFLIRHADASEGEKDLDFGRSLTEIGRRQAQALASRVAGWQLDAIYCSDMTRAHETALALHGHHLGIDLVVDPLFREVSAGVIEEQLDQPDGLLRARMEAVWDKIVTLPHQVAVIVTHNGLIKYLIGRTIHHDGKLKPRFHSAHTGITALRIRPKKRALLQFFNDTSHLSPALIVPGEKAPWIEDPVTRRWHF